MENYKISIYSAKDIEALLRTALEVDEAIMPSLTLLIFAGLRLSEITRFKQADLDFELRKIYVANAGDYKVRTIEGIPDAVWLWLEFYRKNLSFCGADVEFRLRRIFKATTVQGHSRHFRHAFASHLFFIMPQRHLLPAIMGCQPADLKYFGLGEASSESEAKAYFSVTPAQILQ